MRIDRPDQLDALDFTKGDGLVPVVAQHAHTGEVLMVAWADREALRRTLAEARMWYFSRSRNALWRKGETSGNGQRLIALHGDCDSDTVLALVVPEGPSCHTGERTCFGAGAPALAALDRVLEARASAAPEAEPAAQSYTRRLLADENLRLKKLGEEAVELVLACRAGDRARTAAEAADLLYHALVACRAVGVSAADVLAELAARAATSSADGRAGDGRGPAAG
jgi:phosphoribosyl-ATP pyrophosphohydrolase/phosphoribosyl-AMP cyclohydrolase